MLTKFLHTCDQLKLNQLKCDISLNPCACGQEHVHEHVALIALCIFHPCLCTFCAWTIRAPGHELQFGVDAQVMLM